jgi:hypothetical protein
MTLNFNLPAKLMFDARLEQLGFVQDFNGDDVLAGLFSGEVDGTKLAAAEGFSNFKIVQAPLLSLSSSSYHVIGVIRLRLGGAEFLKRSFERLFPGLLLLLLLLLLMLILAILLVQDM